MSSKNSFVHPLKPSDLKIAFEIARHSSKSLMIWGAPGIGKSQITQQYANEMFPLASESEAAIKQLQMEADHPEMSTTDADVAAFKAKIVHQATNLVDFRLSQVEPTDLRGIPVPVTFFVDANNKTYLHPTQDEIISLGLQVRTQTVWAPPAMMNLPADWKGVLFLDEVNGAMPIVQAAAYQLFLDRCIGELKIPDGAFILAAGNRDGDGGVTFELATPLRDRMVHVELTPDLEEWIEYAMLTGRHPDVISYLKARGDDFNTLSPKSMDVCGGASPRSWCAASDMLYTVDTKTFKNRKNAKTSEQILHSMLEGTLGQSIAQQFKTHRVMTSKLPTAMSVLLGQEKDANKITNPDVSKFYAICSNLIYTLVKSHADFISGALPEKDWYSYCNNFLKYLDVSFSEKYVALAIMSIRTLFSNKVLFSPKNVPYYIEFAKKHADLISQARA